MNQELKPVDWKYNYEVLKQLDLEYTKLRYSVFPILMSISFLVAGLAFAAGHNIPSEMRKLALCFGYLIFLVAECFYWWFHRICHKLREELERIEDEHKMNAYKVREAATRKLNIFGKKLRFHWALIVLFLIYSAFILYYIIKC